MSYQSADSPIDEKVKFSNPYNRAVFNTVSFKYEPATLEFSGFFFDLNRKNEKVVVFNFETNTYQPVQFKNGKIIYTADEDVSSSFTTRELNGETWRNETAINTKQGLIFMIDGEYEALNNETQQYEKVIVKNGKVIKKPVEEVKLAEIKSTKSEPDKAEAVVQQKTRAKEEGQKRDETKEVVVEFKKETESRKETPKQQPSELKNKDPELTKDKSNKALEEKKSEPKPIEKQPELKPEQKQDKLDQKSTTKLPQEKSQLEKEPKTPKQQQQKQFKLQNEPEIKREESNKKEAPVFLNREPAIQSDYVVNGAVETRKGKMLSLEIDQKLQLVVNQRTKEFDQIAIQQGLVYLLNANMLPTPIPMQRPEETPKQFLTNDIQIEFCSELIEEQTEECEEMNEMEALQEEVEEMKTRLSLTEEKVQQQEKEINELKKIVRELMKTK
ncbi:Hypothetical_protein [Hexamita inflata]|uniref:Hypothetical_protein n=1 Tax=Hexamita inflata TaxID=28002 RepID=A0AA86P2B9_9EUKA|nr:Hypothetical protein HINF_LOCUS18289 [Hexamita inflata]